MSKKKNTLHDLNEFLKQQAATLVSPDKLGEKFPESTVVVNVTPDPVIPETKEEISNETILRDLMSLSDKEGLPLPKKLYNLILQIFESQKQTSPEDKMLINTALYLKYGDDWKEKISEYWKNVNR